MRSEREKRAPAKVKRKRSVTIRELYETRFNELAFTGEWLELFGTPELTGCWIIWGDSTSGKTTFAMTMARYLTHFGRVIYNSREEGKSKSIREAAKRAGFAPNERKFTILDKESVEEVEVRLGKRKSPDIVFIDSVQYTDLNARTAKELVSRYPKKLFVFISHADGKHPEGRTARSIRYDANVKILVRGFQAKIQSRYGGDKGKTFVIWQEGADNYGHIQF